MNITIKIQALYVTNKFTLTRNILTNRYISLKSSCLKISSNCHRHVQHVLFMDRRCCVYRFHVPYVLAHNYIIKLRGQIKDLALSTEPDLTLIREKIGKCIFTLQSFYSGTNWVEMNNIATYRDFGNYKSVRSEPS